MRDLIQASLGSSILALAHSWLVPAETQIISLLNVSVASTILNSFIWGDRAVRLHLKY